MAEPLLEVPPLTKEVVELMTSGVDLYVATRTAALHPESMFAMATRPVDERRFTVFLAEVLAKPTVGNLQNNGAIAVTLGRPSDHCTMQIKGTCLAIRQADEADRQWLLGQRAALVEQLAFVGVPRATSRRLVWWPSLAVDVQATAVFMQTPGPHAGEPLGTGQQ
jgi:hypothetical protein